MVQVSWILCPQCSFKFYVEASHLAGEQRDKTKWFCPSCKKTFFYGELKEDKDKKNA